MADSFSSAKIGTLFRGKHYRWFDWDSMSVVAGPDSLALFELPQEIDEVDAACVNPLDWDIVWLFRRSKVVDFSVSRRRCVRRGRIKGGSIVTEVVSEIKDHPVFGVLPAALHGGITAAYIGDPNVTPGAGPWLFVAGTGVQVFLPLSSVYRAWVQGTSPREVLSWGPADCVINGAGSRAGQVFMLRDGEPKCVVLDPKKGKTEEDVASLFGGFVPKAGVPVQVDWPNPWDVPAASEGTSTHNAVTVLPPDVLHVWGDKRGKAPTAAGETRAFVNGLPDAPDRGGGKGADPAQLKERNIRLFNRLTAGDGVPDFLRTFVAIRIEGSVSHVKYEIVFYAAPDFLSVGSDFDWMRVPLSVPAEQWVLDFYQCLHPTKPMARAVYDNTPRAQRIPMLGDWGTTSQRSLGGLTSTRAFVGYHANVESRRKPGHALGQLTAGLMKDVVISSPNIMQLGRVVFWGGVFSDGTMAHGGGGDTGLTVPDHKIAAHNEYAMGLRMCYQSLFIRKAGGAWQEKSLAAVLADKEEGFVLRADSTDGRAPYGFEPITVPRYAVGSPETLPQP